MKNDLGFIFVIFKAGQSRRDSGMERKNSLEVIDSSNNDSDLERTGKLENPELNVPLLPDVAEATVDDSNEHNTDVNYQRNGITGEVNSGLWKISRKTQIKRKV